MVNAYAELSSSFKSIFRTFCRRLSGALQLLSNVVAKVGECVSVRETLTNHEIYSSSANYATRNDAGGENDERRV